MTNPFEPPEEHVCGRPMKEVAIDLIATMVFVCYPASATGLVTWAMLDSQHPSWYYIADTVYCPNPDDVAIGVLVALAGMVLMHRLLHWPERHTL